MNAKNNSVNKITNCFWLTILFFDESAPCPRIKEAALASEEDREVIANPQLSSSQKFTITISLKSCFPM